MVARGRTEKRTDPQGDSTVPGFKRSKKLQTVLGRMREPDKDLALPSKVPETGMSKSVQRENDDIVQDFTEARDENAFSGREDMKSRPPLDTSTKGDREESLRNQIREAVREQIFGSRGTGLKPGTPKPKGKPKGGGDLVIRTATEEKKSRRNKKSPRQDSRISKKKKLDLSKSSSESDSMEALKDDGNANPTRQGGPRERRVERKIGRALSKSTGKRSARLGAFFVSSESDDGGSSVVSHGESSDSSGDSLSTGSMSTGYSSGSTRHVRPLKPTSSLPAACPVDANSADMESLLENPLTGRASDFVTKIVEHLKLHQPFATSKSGNERTVHGTGNGGESPIEKTKMVGTQDDKLGGREFKFGKPASEGGVSQGITVVKPSRKESHSESKETSTDKIEAGKNPGDSGIIANNESGCSKLPPSNTQEPQAGVCGVQNIFGIPVNGKKTGNEKRTYPANTFTCDKQPVSTKQKQKDEHKAEEFLTVAEAMIALHHENDEHWDGVSTLASGRGNNVAGSFSKTTNQSTPTTIPVEITAEKSAGAIEVQVATGEKRVVQSDQDQREATGQILDLVFSSDSEEQSRPVEAREGLQQSERKGSPSLPAVDEESAASLSYSVATELEQEFPPRKHQYLHTPGCSTPETSHITSIAPGGKRVLLKPGSPLQSGIEAENILASTSEGSVQTEKAVSKGLQGDAKQDISRRVEHFEKKLSNTGVDLARHQQNLGQLVTNDDVQGQASVTSPRTEDLVTALSLTSEVTALVPDTQVDAMYRVGFDQNESPGTTGAQKTEPMTNQFYDTHRQELFAKIKVLSDQKRTSDMAESQRNQPKNDTHQEEPVGGSSGAPDQKKTPGTTATRKTEPKTKKFYDDHQVELFAKIKEFQMRREAKAVICSQNGLKQTSKTQGSSPPINSIRTVHKPSMTSTNTQKSKEWPSIPVSKQVTGKKVAHAYIQALAKSPTQSISPSEQAVHRNETIEEFQAGDTTVLELGIPDNTQKPQPAGNQVPQISGRIEPLQSERVDSALDQVRVPQPRQYEGTEGSQNAKPVVIHRIPAREQKATRKLLDKALVDMLTVTSGSASDDIDGRAVSHSKNPAREENQARINDRIKVKANGRPPKQERQVSRIGSTREVVTACLLDEILLREDSVRSSSMSSGGSSIVGVDDLVSKIDDVVHRLVKSGKIEVNAEPNGKAGLHQRTLQKNTAELLRNLAILRARRSNAGATLTAKSTKPAKVKPREKSRSLEDSDVPSFIFKPATLTSDSPSNRQLVAKTGQSSDNPNIAILRARRDHAVKIIQRQTKKLTGRSLHTPSQRNKTRVAGLSLSVMEAENAFGTREYEPSESHRLPLKRVTAQSMLIESNTEGCTQRRGGNTKSNGPPKPESFGRRPPPKCDSTRNPRSTGQGSSKIQVVVDVDDGHYKANHEMSTQSDIASSDLNALQKLPRILNSLPREHFDLTEHYSSSFDLDSEDDDDSDSGSEDDSLRLERIESMIKELRARRSAGSIG